MSLTYETKPFLPQDTIFIFDNDTKILLRSDIPTWVAVNKDLAILLELCDGNKTVNEMINKLVIKYNVSRAEMASIVISQLQALTRRKILDIDKVAGTQKSIELCKYSLNKLWLAITHRCNYRCMHCYVSKPSRLRDEITLEEIHILSKQMRKLRELNTPQYVIITGGEPLLRADIWDICKSFKSEEIGVVLLTNGSLIDDQNIDDVCKFVDFVQISVDGTETINDKIRGKGAFKKTLEGVQILLSRGRKPHIAIVASRKNKADIPSLVLMLQRLGLYEIKVRPVIISGKAALNKERLSLSAMNYKDVIMNIYRAIQENSVDKPIMMRIERFLSHVKNPTKNIYGCQAAISMCSVDPQGFVYPCIASHFEEFRAGSIRESTLDSIWLSSPVLAQWRTLDVRRKTKCNSCMWRLFCGGGCKINAYLKHGNLLFPDPYCSAYKSLYKDALLKVAHHCFENVKYEKESPVSECE